MNKILLRCGLGMVAFGLWIMRLSPTHKLSADDRHLIQGLLYYQGALKMRLTGTPPHENAKKAQTKSQRYL